MRLAVCVEGQTEEEFIKVVLAAHLRPLRIEPDPILIGRGRESGGGSVTVKRLTVDMALLYQTHDAVTSLVDFYGFQRRGGRTVDALEAHLRGEIGRVVGDGWDEQRVFPYVQMHEFEGLLFSDVSAFASLIGATTESVDALRAIRAQFPTPEQINDNSDTAPMQAHRRCGPEVQQACRWSPTGRDNRYRRHSRRVPAIQRLDNAPGGSEPRG